MAVLFGTWPEWAQVCAMHLSVRFLSVQTWEANFIGQLHQIDDSLSRGRNVKKLQILIRGINKEPAAI